MGFDELEALRLADLEGMYQADIAGAMNVSRATAGRIVAEARRKMAEAVVMGRTLVVQGGDVLPVQRCGRCGGWHPEASGEPETTETSWCPGPGRGRGRGRGNGPGGGGRGFGGGRRGHGQ